MATEVEYVNYKDFVAGLESTEAPGVDDVTVVSNETDGPRATPLNSKALTTAADESDLNENSSIDIYTANGRKKLLGNAVAKASDVAALQTKTGNISASIAPEYVPANGAVAGRLYMHEGSLYRCKNDTSGDWVAANFVRVSSDDLSASVDAACRNLRVMQPYKTLEKCYINSLYELISKDDFNVEYYNVEGIESLGFSYWGGIVAYSIFKDSSGNVLYYFLGTAVGAHDVWIQNVPEGAVTLELSVKNSNTSFVCDLRSFESVVDSKLENIEDGSLQYIDDISDRRYQHGNGLLINDPSFNIRVYDVRDVKNFIITGYISNTVRCLFLDSSNEVLSYFIGKSSDGAVANYLCYVPDGAASFIMSYAKSYDIPSITVIESFKNTIDGLNNIDLDFGKVLKQTGLAGVYYNNTSRATSSNISFSVGIYRICAGKTIRIKYHAGSVAYSLLSKSDGTVVQSFVGTGSTNLTDYTITIPSDVSLLELSYNTEYGEPQIYYVGSIYESLLTLLNPDVAHTLNGKKIAVIGDSISTIKDNNSPYWTVKDIDVGQEIQAYVTWFDVYKNQAGTTPTNKTIGGVTLTEAMVGTLQTFTPIDTDIGKTIGVAQNYNAETTTVWSQVLAEVTGATLIANASYSGSSMCGGQSSPIYALSHAFSDYTIKRCRKRNDDGSYTNPDVIFIYRGTNDMTHGQARGSYSVLDDYDLMTNGYPETDVNSNGLSSFRRAYYMTIAALREAYPNAMIYCCTLNVFKRITYDRYPTRNSLYSLPMMNKVIREIATEMGCGLVDFERDGITFENCYSEGYITDSETTPTHPNSKGHEVMAYRAIRDCNFTL